MGKGLLDLPFLEQRIAEIVMSFHIVGIGRQRALVLSHRFVHPASLKEDQAQVIVGEAAFRVPGEGCPPERFGVPVDPALPPAQRGQQGQQGGAQRDPQHPPSPSQQLQAASDASGGQRQRPEARDVLIVIGDK